MIRVLLADDHPVVREGLRGMLDAEPDLTVVGEASSGPRAEALCAELLPDIVLMDLRMPGGGGVASIRRIRAAALPCRVVVLTTYESDSDILRAVEAGASGYLLRTWGGLSWRTRSGPRPGRDGARADGGDPAGGPVARSAGGAPARSARLRCCGWWRRVHQRGDRAAAVHRGVDGEDPFAARLRQARRQRPYGGGDGGDAPRAAVDGCGAGGRTWCPPARAAFTRCRLSRAASPAPPRPRPAVRRSARRTPCP